MDNVVNVDLDIFFVLYSNVRNKYNIPNYEKKLKVPYSDTVITNYYKMIYLLRKYGIYNYLNNDLFQLLFVRMVFDGTMESIEANFEYLKELYDRTDINILYNIDKLIRLFSSRNYSLINCSLQVVEIAHSFIYDLVSSEMVKEKYGASYEFCHILDDYASGKEYPELFHMVFPLFERSPNNWIGEYLAENVVTQNVDHILEEVMIAETTKNPHNLNNPTLYTVKVREDMKFLEDRYKNMPRYSWSDVFLNLRTLNCYTTLMGSFTYLFKRLESINRNVVGGNFSIFDELMKPENLPLLDKIVCSLDSYVDYKDFRTAKSVDYNDFTVQLVDDLASKLFFYSSLYHFTDESQVFSSFYHTNSILKIIAQIKKDELGGKITSEVALSKVNEIFQYFKDVQINKGIIRFHIDKGDKGNKANSDEAKFRNLLQSYHDVMSEYSENQRINENNFGIYLSLCDDYFKKNDSVFLSVDDFIVHTLLYNKNGIIESDEIGNLIDTDFNLLNVVPFDLLSILGIEGILNRQKSFRKLTFVDDLYTCSAFKFQDCDVFSEKKSSEAVNILFDTMAVRYHSRIKFGRFELNGEHTKRERGIYKLKELFRNGSLCWEKDRIHVYNYFLYLENNLAHDIDERAIDYYLKEQDYFSSNLKKMKDVIEDFFKKSEIKDSENVMKISNISNLSDSLLDIVYSKLEHEKSISERWLSEFVKCSEPSLITEFVNFVNNNFDSCFLYVKLLREQEQDFKYKDDYAVNIINDFYSKLMIIRVENGTFDPDNLQLTPEEQRAFYERFGYLIDIRYDFKKKISVLYIMDQLMEVSHSVHLKGLEQVNIKSFNNKELKCDETIDTMFDNCHLKVSKNKRQNIIINNNFVVSDEIYSILKTEFDNAPDFVENDFIERLIKQYSLFPNYPEYAYYYVCCCLKLWNENKILGVDRTRTFGNKQLL